MTGNGTLRKRPCRICKRWFAPNLRLKDRQKTCGAPACRREWHRRKCRQWNRDNSEYFKANSLHRKLEESKRHVKGEASGNNRQPQPNPSVSRSGLPLEVIQEVMGTQVCVIIEYLAQQLLRRFQEVIRRTSMKAFARRSQSSISALWSFKAVLLVDYPNGSVAPV